MITQPFPFNDQDNVIENPFRFRRDNDIGLSAQSGPNDFLIRGAGYWAGFVSGFFDGDIDALKVKDFLDTYTDYRPFDINLSNWNVPFSEVNNAINLVPSGQVSVAGQNYLQFANQSAALDALKAANPTARIGWSKGHYFAYKGLLFKLAADQQTNGDWRIPIFPNITFDAIAGGISQSEIEIQAVLDRSSELPQVSLRFDTFQVIQIHWIQGKEWA